MEKRFLGISDSSPFAVNAAAFEANLSQPGNKRRHFVKGKNLMKNCFMKPEFWHIFTFSFVRRQSNKC